MESKYLHELNPKDLVDLEYIIKEGTCVKEYDNGCNDCILYRITDEPFPKPGCNNDNRLSITKSVLNKYRKRMRSIEKILLG